MVEQTYLNSYVAHAPMETHSAVAAVENGKVTVWASTQTPFPLKNQLMQALNLPAEKVRVITPYVGGGFGGKSAGRQAIEAARLAVTAGVPVRVVWSREEEFFFDTFRPAAVLKIRSGIDAAGKITLLGLRGRRRRRTRVGAHLRHPAPSHASRAAGGTPTRRGCTRSRIGAVAGAGRQQQRVRARVAHRRAGGAGRRSIRSSSG